LVNGSLITYSTNASLFLTQNAYFNAAGSWTYLNTGTAGQYSIDGTGNHVFYTAVSGTGGNTATLNERMRITSDGLVGIGTSSPYYALTISGSTDAASGIRIKNTNGITSAPRLIIEQANSQKMQMYAYGDAFTFNYNLTGGLAFYDGINSTSRLSITSTGASQFDGPTLSIGSQGTYAIQVGESGQKHLTLSYKQSNGGYIQTWQSSPMYLNSQGNGVYAGSVRLDTLSDERIKDNIEPISNSLNKILQLNGKKFHLKDEPADKIRYGFIAQDLEGILDEFVIQTNMTFTKDDLVVENVKSIDNWASSWAALLVEAIKELSAKNTALEEILQRNNIQ
jgi:hypothetical protein